MPRLKSSSYENGRQCCTVRAFWTKSGQAPVLQRAVFVEDDAGIPPPRRDQSDPVEDMASLSDGDNSACYTLCLCGAPGLSLLCDEKDGPPHTLMNPASAASTSRMKPTVANLPSSGGPGSSRDQAWGDNYRTPSRTSCTKLRPLISGSATRALWLFCAAE